MKTRLEPACLLGGSLHTSLIRHPTLADLIPTSLFSSIHTLSLIDNVGLDTSTSKASAAEPAESKGTTCGTGTCSGYEVVGATGEQVCGCSIERKKYGVGTG